MPRLGLVSQRLGLGLEGLRFHQLFLNGNRRLSITFVFA